MSFWHAIFPSAVSFPCSRQNKLTKTAMYA
jgi:hypothetical protein